TAFEKLCEIVAKLRAPGGCPWDREQTHESLLPALIEEAYEVTEAARAKNDAHFREELGDLLLLVVMHAEIAQESGRFDIDNVLQEISDKLVRRHPHVFGTSDARDSGAVLKQWEAIKREMKDAIASQDRGTIDEEIGDVLFAVVNLARKCKIDAESALQKATNKFMARFNRVEDELRRQGKRLGDVDLSEMDAIWNEIKQTPNAELF